MATKIGGIGLGIMGSAFSKNCLEAGLDVVGYDVDQGCLDRHTERGGTVVGSPADVTQQADICFSSLPKVVALDSVVDDLVANGKAGTVILETSTFPIDDKQRAHDRLAEAGIILLDCPISGTGSQAETRDIMLYGSGDEAAFDSARPLVDAVAKNTKYIGPFGNGSKMKYVANLLVANHVASAAEAMVVGIKGGLEPQMIYDVISESPAAVSAMFTVRGKLMVDRNYEPAQMKVEVWQKDITVIGDFIKSIDADTPLFDAGCEMYRQAMDEGLALKDTASVCTVVEKRSKLER